MKIALTNCICKSMGCIFLTEKREDCPKKSLLLYLTLNYRELPLLIRQAERHRYLFFHGKLSDTLALFFLCIKYLLLRNRRHDKIQHCPLR